MNKMPTAEFQIGKNMCEMSDWERGAMNNGTDASHPWGYDFGESTSTDSSKGGSVGGFALSEQEAVEFRHGLLILLGAWEKMMTRLGFLTRPTTKELRDMHRRGDLT